MYRLDFYTKTNVIGYIGSVSDFPTVFFYNENTHEFGHIVTSPEFSRINGRQEVQSEKDYCIFNSISKIQHPSSAQFPMLERKTGLVSKFITEDIAIEYYHGEIQRVYDKPLVILRDHFNNPWVPKNEDDWPKHLDDIPLPLCEKLMLKCLKVPHKCIGFYVSGSR
ncbi:MAG: hypothetical protein LPH20_15545 [Shewanella sp.]|nr:hypothetical protein [Shewanella sp.]